MPPVPSGTRPRCAPSGSATRARGRTPHRPLSEARVSAAASAAPSAAASARPASTTAPPTPTTATARTMGRDEAARQHRDRPALRPPRGRRGHRGRSARIVTRAWSHGSGMSGPTRGQVGDRAVRHGRHDEITNARPARDAHARAGKHPQTGVRPRGTDTAGPRGLSSRVHDEQLVAGDECELHERQQEHHDRGQHQRELDRGLPVVRARQSASRRRMVLT